MQMCCRKQTSGCGVCFDLCSGCFRILNARIAVHLHAQRSCSLYAKIPFFAAYCCLQSALHACCFP
ncbi:MAG TPA: hypothetical protein DCG49_05995 [Ruminococcus sp.]|nr:hypothetical protein [Ruminococcus sp.]